MTQSRLIRCTLAAAIPLIAALSSCSKKPPSSPVNSQEPVIVSAAASTKDVLEALARRFKDETGIAVKINPGPSNGLANQIIAGAPADLFLSASAQWANEVDKASQAAAQARLLTNQLVLIVPKDNPAGVHQSSDLLGVQVKKIALAGENVPAGIYAAQALTKLGLFESLVDQNKIARGQDVRGALNFVERGEAEAGIVYSTDVRVAPGTTTVYEFDPTTHDEIVYVLVLLKHGERTPAARRFYDFLQSPVAETEFQKFGFSRLPL